MGVIHMEISKEELTAILRQRRASKEAKKVSPDDLRQGDTFVILHKEEKELIVDLLYDALGSKYVSKESKKTALQAIKHIEGDSNDDDA
ncbi:hypothetical protein EalM132_00139 [Exiguobacterium phage vB_EalM-132]|nr:hypothetical protein EalM132_00139 [Exiguobacterium phage vB_EalM-132]